MKTNKLSAIEKMRVKRAYLVAEEQSHLDKLNKHIDYLQNHWGSLLINSGMDAVKSRTLPLVQSFFGNNVENKKRSPKTGSFMQKYPHIGAVTSQLIDILPLFLKGPKSKIAAFILKTAKDFLLQKN